jgi:phosphoglycolate phosphatase-like HAD superfamily hydrolase/ADP-ribose pyrophosphatase YjhB (NUDIX family)
MIRNVIFDWSGTLVDDLPAVWKAANHVLKSAGRPEVGLEQFRAEFCPPYQKFFDRYAPGVPGQQVEVWFHASLRESQDSVVALPHTREFLEFCRQRGARMTVLSAITAEHFTKQAAAIDFARYFKAVHLGAADKRQMIHTVLKEEGFAPGETLFIGDMPHDIEAAHHGGVHSCAVLTGYCGLEQLRTAGPEWMVEHLGELREILERTEMCVKPEEIYAHPVVTVGGLIFDDAGKVLMVRTHKWSGLWGIPGGKIKWGEKSEDALRRELKEETNLDVTDIRFVLVQDCIHSTEFYRDAHFVLLNYTARCAGAAAVKLNDEAREYVWVAPEQALAMKLNQPTRVLLEAAINSKLKIQN